MRLTLTLALPRDTFSVPVVRRVLTDAMATLGVLEDCVSDVAVALSEACTNVLRHAREGDAYEVSAGINERSCVLQVTDKGAGFAADDLGRVDAHPESEFGRGIQLMRSLVDDLHFERLEAGGTVVRLVKELAWREGAPLRMLAAALEPAVGEPPVWEEAVGGPADSGQQNAGQ
jgi:serine/threonine-protein kinase RsbW